MYRLGAQGRAAQQQLAQRPYTGTSRLQPQRLHPSSEDKQDQDVTLLLSILTSQSASHSKEQLLSYVVHYVPRVKREEDVHALTSALLSNPLLFNPLDFDGCYLVIEAVKALFEHKIRISQPTLPLTNFFHGFTSSLYHHVAEDWKKILVLTGILLSKPVYHDHSVPESRGFFEQSYQGCIQLNHELITRCFRSTPLLSLEVNSLVTLSLACSLISFSDSQRRKLPHESIMIQTVDLVFNSPFGLANGVGDPHETVTRPVMKHLSRCSFLIENCFVNGVKYPVMDGSLSILLDFAFTLHSKCLPIIGDPQTWEVLKSILFGVVIMLQGFASFSLNLYNGLKTDEYSILSTKVIKTLYFLNFILEKIGTGGFQAYNFVFLTAIDGLFQYSSRSAEQLGSFMITHVDLNQVPQSHYESSKAMFAINYFEHFTKSCPHGYHDAVIAPFIDHFIQSPSLLPPTTPQNQITTHRMLIEAAHSVVLATFTPNNAAIVATIAPSYLRTVLSQFPLCLSSRQLNFAVESITRAVAPPSEAYYLNKDNLREVLHTLYIAIINSPCSQPLIENPGIAGTAPTTTASSGGPQTVRQALISSLIGTLTYIPVGILENWLNNVWELSQGDVFLEQELWKQISEGLDMQRGTIGVQWWYNRGNVGVRTKL